MTANPLAHQVIYRPMVHPHFIRADVARALEGVWPMRGQLGYLGQADDPEQLELFDVDWTLIKSKGQPTYRIALLAEAQGKQLGMPQETIDESIRLLLGKHEGLNMFRALFGFYPYERKRYDVELAIIGSTVPTVKTWYETNLLVYAGKRAELLRQQAKKVVTALELDEIAKRAKWSKQQIKDALSGQNIYQIKRGQPIPWLYIAVAMAAGVGIAYWWYRR